MVYLQDLAAGAPADHSFFPFSWHLANPRWWDDLGVAPFHPTIPPEVHVPDVTHPTFYSTTSLQCVPFVNRPFESEIHGTVNFTYFCCFLLVTWCHCVLLSCYLRPK